jgi:hypothetical protein
MRAIWREPSSVRPVPHLLALKCWPWRCGAQQVGCPLSAVGATLRPRRRNRVSKPDPSKEGPVSKGTGLSSFLQNLNFVLNLKTAKSLGLSIPESVILRADRVIE